MQNFRSILNDVNKLKNDFFRSVSNPIATVKSMNPATMIQNATPFIQKFVNKQEIKKQLLNAEISAYSASEDETDEDPTTTSTGTRTREGIVASNNTKLYGKKVKIDGKVYTVEDTMHPRYRDEYSKTGKLRFDIVKPSKKEALEFGRKNMFVEILDDNITRKRGGGLAMGKVIHSKPMGVIPYKDTSGYCGPASLKMVLKKYGIDKSEEHLARLSGATKRYGVDDDGMLKAVKKLGFKAIAKEYSTLDEIKSYLKKDIPVIVGWFSVNEGHYSVVVGLDAKNIKIADPEFGKVREMSRKDFEKVWFSYDGYKMDPSKVNVREIIVIFPK